MRLKGHTVQAAPISLEVLQVWLGRLLELQEPPSVAECAEGHVVLAGLHKVLSHQPLVSQSAANLLHAGTPKSTVFQMLASELQEAGLEQHKGLLDAVADADSEALETLLIAIYQHYAINHAHKFSTPSTPQTKEPVSQLEETHTSGSDNSGTQQHRSSGGAGYSFNQQLMATLTAVTPRNHPRESQDYPQSARFSRQHMSPLAISDGEALQQDAGAAFSSPDGEAAKDRVEQLLLGEGLPGDTYLAATQACLATWLGSVAGRQDPVGRMLLSNSSQEVKVTMLANGAAYRSALAALLGTPPPGRHATAKAIVNTTEALDSLESAGYQVFHKLRRQCVTELDSLSPKSQMVLGAAVLQVAFQRQAAAVGEAGVLDWARALLLEAGVSETGDGGRGAWGHWHWGALHPLAAHCLQAPSGVTGASEAESYQRLDSLCSAQGLTLPFALTDLPAALPGNTVMQLLLAVFLADLRSAAGPSGASMPSSPLRDPPAVELSCDVMQQDTTAEEFSAMDLTVSDATEVACYARSASSATDASPARASHASPGLHTQASVSPAPAETSRGGGLQEAGALEDSRPDASLSGRPVDLRPALDDAVQASSDVPAMAIAGAATSPTLAERGDSAVAGHCTGGEVRPASRGGRFDEELLLRASPARSGLLRGSASVAEGGRTTPSHASSVAASLPAGIVFDSGRPSTRGRSPSASLIASDTGMEAAPGGSTLPSEDVCPQHLSSFNGSVAEVLTVGDDESPLSEEEETNCEISGVIRWAPEPMSMGDDVEKVDEATTAVSQTPFKPMAGEGEAVFASRRRPATAGATALSTQHGDGSSRRSTGRPLRPTSATGKAMRGSLVPVDMFAPPAQRRPDRGSESVSRLSAASQRSSGFLQRNVFAPPQPREQADEPAPPSPEACLEKVAAESGIGRFRAKVSGSRAVSASVAHDAQRGFCPALSASTPSLELAADPQQRPPREERTDELFADTMDPEEAAALLAATRSTLAASSPESSPERLPDIEESGEEETRGVEDEDAEAVAAVRQLPVLELSDDLLAQIAEGQPEERPPTASEAVHSVADSIEALEVTLNPHQAHFAMPAIAELEEKQSAVEEASAQSCMKVARRETSSSTEAIGGKSNDCSAEELAPQATPSRQHDLHVGSRIPPPSPQILASASGVVAPADESSGLGHHRNPSREILACGAGVAEQLPITRLPRPPPRPPVEAPVAFNIGDELTNVDDGATDAVDDAAKAKEEQRLRRVQAMLDAKRERFLQERKEKEVAAAERAAREERQRKALAKAREKEAAERGRNARRAAEAAAISRAAEEAQAELGIQPTSKASAPASTAVSVIAPTRPREQVLAEATLPLEEHLAKLVATAVESDIGDGEDDGAVPSSMEPTPVGRSKAQSARATTGASTHGAAQIAARNPAPPSFSRASNRKLVRNALAHVCLAGAARTKEKEAALAAMDAYKGDDSFIVLFKGSSAPLHFKGLYLHPRDGGPVARLYGKGPDSVDPQRVATFFKYDSGAREFRAMQTTNFNFGTTCGIAQS